MKQEEKTELTRERILQAALEEFGTKGYAAFTVNALCAGHQVPKGLLYHNFHGKDGLYLACVERCFAQVVEGLRQETEGAGLEAYLQARFRYFSSRPLQARVFFEAVLQPPEHLRAQVRERKGDFDRFNRGVYRNAISGLALRPGVTEEDAMEYYAILQEMFNGWFSSPAYSGGDFSAVARDHEKKLSGLLDLMLYGIARRDEV